MTCTEIPITIKIEEPDIDAVLLDFDQIQIHRSTTDETGPYSELTDARTRINLEAGVADYQYEDTEGSADYWYKFRYFNSTTQVADTFSDPQPGEPHPALQILSVEELKQIYLFGIDLTDDRSNPYPPILFAHSIKAAVSWIEDKLDIPLITRRYVDEPHDYYREDYRKYLFMQLPNHPIIGVESVKLVLPGEQLVQEFDQSWMHLQRFEGHLQLLPGSGTAGTLLLSPTGAYFPYLAGSNRFIPDAFRVTYEAGFGRPSNQNMVSRRDPKLDEFPSDLKELVGKVASFGPLNIAGDLLGGAGIASVSLGLDGLSQSFATTSSATNAGYGARLTTYNRELKDWIPTLRRYYHGHGLTVV